MVQLNIPVEVESTMSSTFRSALATAFQAYPIVLIAAVVALLAPFSAAVAATLAVLVGAGAWTRSLSRRSTLVPEAGPFIGS